MEQQRLLRCDDDGRQTSVAPNTLCEAVLNVSAAAFFMSVKPAGEKQAVLVFAALPPTWLVLCVRACRAHPQQLKCVKSEKKACGVVPSCRGISVGGGALQKSRLERRSHLLAHVASLRTFKSDPAASELLGPTEPKRRRAALGLCCASVHKF